MEELMGKDIRLEDDDLRFSRSQDFSIITGYENLKQAIMNRLRTIKGELHNNFYGSELNKCFSLPINQTLKNQILGYVIEALNQEPRILRKDEINVEFMRYGTQNYAVVDMKITPIESNVSLNLVFPFFLE